jgi:hypothetical protein
MTLRHILFLISSMFATVTFAGGTASTSSTGLTPTEQARLITPHNCGYPDGTVNIDHVDTCQNAIITCEKKLKGVANIHRRLTCKCRAAFLPGGNLFGSMLQDDKEIKKAITAAQNLPCN